jgi:hypothetical protein
MVLNQFAQLADAQYRCPIHGEHHIDRLNAGLGSVAFCIFHHQSAGDTGLRAVLDGL